MRLFREGGVFSRDWYGLLSGSPSSYFGVLDNYV